MLCHWTVLTLLAFLSRSHVGGATQLTQETPCMLNQRCLLKCVLDSNSGIFFYTLGSNRNVTIASCRLQQSCTSFFPESYNFTRASNSMSFLEILRFADYDADYWSCSDGPNLQVTTIRVIQNTVPMGPLTFGSTPCRVVSPATLTCSLPSPGIPPATLTIVDSSSQPMGSSNASSVTGTVTRGGQASCSVRWPAFPVYSLNINPVFCDVQVPARAVITSVQASTTVTITCEAYGGYPAAATFGAWTHSWGGRLLRTIPAQAQGNKTTLILTSFQDTGTYNCSVSNQVDGFKSNITSVQVEDFPQLLRSSDIAVQAAEVNESVVLFCPLYSVPNITNVTWSFNSTPIRGVSAEFQPALSAASVSLPVHNTRVDVQGFNATLAFRFKESNVGNYSLEACNMIGCRSAQITLQETGPPHTPVITEAAATSDSVTLTWVPGFSGGDFSQWFHLNYRRQDSSEERWVDAARDQIRSSTDKTPVTLTVTGLEPDTTYVFSVQAQNSRRERNRSSFQERIVTTEKVLSSAGPSTGALAGGIVGGLLGLTVLVVVIIVVVRKRRGRAGEDDKPLQKMAMQDTRRGNANPGFTSSPGKGPYQPVHPILEDNILYDSSSNNVPQSPPDSALYAVVDKKDKKAKAAGQGKKGDKKDKKGKTGSKIYENSDGATTSGQVHEKPGPVRENVDGLMYSTVVIDRKPGEAARPALAKAAKPSRPDDQYKDEKVVYTAIDHTKRV